MSLPERGSAAPHPPEPLPLLRRSESGSAASLRRRLPGRLPLLFLLSSATPLSAAPPWGVRPAPVWVVHLEAPLAREGEADDVHGGMDYLLVDQQIRATTRSEERYSRQVRRVLSPSGVQNASELTITFDPSYERLVFHHIQLERGGRTIDALVPGEIKVIQREASLGEGIYDGTLTAVVFLKDVRPGDVIDHAYTLEGGNPILGGRFATVLEMGYGVPTRRIHHRILWPSDRALYLHGHRTSVDPEIREQGGVRSYEWDLQDISATDEDDETPPWYDPYPWVQVGDFASWAEVAGWARKLFDSARQPHAVDALAARLRAEHRAPEEQALAAIRFVQDEIRYLGLEMGPGSHRPQSPARVLEQRYGDCKDKSLLLVTLLEGLGIEADPALVQTTAGATLDKWQPSPFAFDHAIVRATVGGKTLWIDATVSGQGGGLADFETPEFPRALVLRPETTALSALGSPGPTVPTTVVEEMYTVGEPGPRLEVKTTHTGGEADAMREVLATTPIADVAKTYLNHYAQDSLRIEPDGLPHFQDDRRRNVVTVLEAYRLPGFWTSREKSFSPWALEERLRKPGSPRRAAPLAVEHPVHVVHTITVRLPRPLAVPPEEVTVDDPAFRFRHAARIEGQTVTLSYAYASLTDHVPAERLEAYLGHLEDARRHLSHSLDPQAHPARALAVPLVLLLVSGLLALTLGIVVAARLRRRRGAASPPVVSAVAEAAPADPASLLTGDAVPPTD